MSVKFLRGEVNGQKKGGENVKNFSLKNENFADLFHFWNTIFWKTLLKCKVFLVKKWN